ncbi:MAG TPA: c-type cytochrome [Opitutaceae bacterium]|nr:c-type cytochrome [Opitutaceae bacterium]
MSRFAASILAWAALASPASLADNGKEVYLASCAACHGQDGRARTAAGRKLGAKDLTASKLTDAEVRKQVSEGHTDQRGALMPAFKDILKPDQIDAVVAFAKTLRK